jgi:hypothetical protein
MTTTWRWTGIVSLALVVGYAVAVARLEPFTLPTEIAITAAIVAMVGLAIHAGWLRRGPVGDRSDRASRTWWLALAIWLVLIGAISLFQLAQFQSNPRDVYPTLSSLASIAFAHWPVRAAAIVAWIALGLHLVGPRR